MKDLADRTKAFALDVLKLCATFQNKPAVSIITRQLMRSATSVGANYRAACRGQSRAAFIAKLSIVEEEADECIYWMELLEEITPESGVALGRLKAEANELLAITVASKKTARQNT
jgi:four helix bundle protein